MRVFGTIGLLLVAAFWLVWAMNVSFAAHLQEKARNLWLFHIYSFLLVMAACTAIFFVARVWSL